MFFLRQNQAVAAFPYVMGSKESKPTIKPQLGPWTISGAYSCDVPNSQVRSIHHLQDTRLQESHAELPLVVTLRKQLRLVQSPQGTSAAGLIPRGPVSSHGWQGEFPGQ